MIQPDSTADVAVGVAVDVAADESEEKMMSLEMLLAEAEYNDLIKSRPVKPKPPVAQVQEVAIIQKPPTLPRTKEEKRNLLKDIIVSKPTFVENLQPNNTELDSPETSTPGEDMLSFEMPV